MTAQVYAIHPSVASHESQISRVRYLDRVAGVIGEFTVAQLIAWLDGSTGAKADVVSNGGAHAWVTVVRPEKGAAYIRTSPDETRKDNLLSLPKF